MKVATALLLLFLIINVSYCKIKSKKHVSGLHKGLLRPDYTYEDMFSVREDQDQAPEQYFSNYVDHFNPGNTQKFDQRYFLNTTYFDQENCGPIFVILGGEGPISPTDVNSHFILGNYAPIFKSATVSIEHRFYGKSQPFSSTATENLTYLTSLQALADFSLFFDYLRNDVLKCPESQIITFGGSYSGALAAWMRLKYPHVTTGSIASSGPVQALLDFDKYLVTVGDGLRNQGSQTCYENVQSATQQIVSMLSTSTGISSLEQLFNTCSPINSAEDKQTFLESITDPVAGVIQYNNDNVNYQLYNVESMCNILTNGSNALDQYAYVVNQINQFNGENCTESSYQQMINELSVTTLDDTAGRCWTWQTCTEFGYFQTGEDSNQPFSSDLTLDFFTNICKDTFGEQYNVPFTNLTNILYGSNQGEPTRVVFPNGSVDPWHNLGQLKPMNEFQTSILIEGTAHCADLYPPSQNDVPGLENARQVELNEITLWLSGGY